MNIYVVRDALANKSGSIFECENHLVAIRQFRITIKNMAEKGLDPSDFKLICIGRIDHETDTITPIPSIILDPHVPDPSGNLAMGTGH